MKKLLKSLLAASMLMSGVAVSEPVFAFDAPLMNFTEERNFAMEGVPSAYNSPISYWGPDKLIDGVINRDADKPEQSRWSSEVGAPGWVKIDLQQERTFDEFLCAFENDKVRQFHIDISNDDQSYETIFTSEDKTDGHPMDSTVELSEPVTARYVKLTIDSLISGAYPSVTPGMQPFNAPHLVLAVIGLLIIVVLMVMQVKGAMLIGIIATTIIGIPMGVTQLPASIFSGSETVQGFRDVAFSFFGNPGLGSLFSTPAKIPFVLVTIFSMCLSDTFDSIGTFIGTGRKSHIFDEEDEKALEGSGFKSRLDKALVADSFATSIGALFGTSNATTFVESSAGIAAGGRTGLTSLVTAIMFLICLPFSGLIGMVPSAATSPALIVVGILMVEPFAEINWKDLKEAVPAFFTVAVMSFTYGITNGIAAGFIMYCLTKICTKKAREIHPIIAVASVLSYIRTPSRFSSRYSAGLKVLPHTRRVKRFS